MSAREQSSYGLLAQFDGAASLLQAAKALHEAGYKRFDCHSAFPIHGMDRAMGLQQSKLGWIVLLGGFSGAAGGMLLQWWTSAIDYPLVISGKPLFSFQAFVPITFELTILFAAFGAVFGMLALNRLPRLHQELFNSGRFKQASDDGFFISVQAGDPQFDEAGTKSLLRQLGAQHIEVIERG